MKRLVLSALAILFVVMAFADNADAIGRRRKRPRRCGVCQAQVEPTPAPAPKVMPKKM